MMMGVVFTILALSAPAASSSASADGKAAFERLKSLAGEWQGAVGAPGGPPASIRFDGGTNFAPASDLHIHDGWIRFTGPDRLEEDWTVYKAGKQTADHRFILTRKK